METRNDGLTSADTIKKTCACCFKKYDVSVFSNDDDETDFLTRWCSMQCALADLY